MNKKQKILAIFITGLILFAGVWLPQLSKAVDTGFTGETSFTASANKAAQQAAQQATQQAPPNGTDQNAEATFLGGYIVGRLGAYLVQAGAFLTNLSLALNLEILDANLNPLIPTGWTICRDLANLGFVLFIIIIAIATILRYESYAAKSTLAKLIAVALLVNFSLMGAGILVDFSNMLTNFFINKGVGSTSDLATTLASSFNPGKFLQVKDPQTTNSYGGLLGLIDTVKNPLGALKALLIWVSGIFFVIIFCILLAFVFFALAIMFLIRYIALDILLVLVPLACLFWVIPATKHLWEKWWKGFIRWILFAPAASFFLYLALRILSNQAQMNRLTNLANGSSNLLAGFNDLPNADLPSQIASMVVLIGFVMGGLMVANSMGITGAKTFYNWAQAGGKWFGRQTLEQTAGKALGTKRIREATEKLSASKIPGVRYLGRGLNRLGARVGAVTQKPYEEIAKRLSPDQLNYEILNSRGIKRAVLLNAAAKRKDIDMEKLDKIINNPAELEKIQGEFKTAGLNFNNLSKAAGRDLDMVKEAAAMEDAHKKGNDAEYKLAAARLQTATKKFFERMSPEDRKKIQWNPMFKTKNPISENIQNETVSLFIKDKENFLKQIVPKITSSFDNFEKIVNKQIDRLEADYATKDEAIELRKEFKKSLGSKLFQRSEAEAPPPET